MLGVRLVPPLYSAAIAVFRTVADAEVRMPRFMVGRCVHALYHERVRIAHLLAQQLDSLHGRRQLVLAIAKVESSRIRMICRTEFSAFSYGSSLVALYPKSRRMNPCVFRYGTNTSQRRARPSPRFSLAHSGHQNARAPLFPIATGNLGVPPGLQRESAEEWRCSWPASVSRAPQTMGTHPAGCLNAPGSTTKQCPPSALAPPTGEEQH